MTLKIRYSGLAISLMIPVIVTVAIIVKLGIQVFDGMISIGEFLVALGLLSIPLYLINEIINEASVRLDAKYISKRRFFAVRRLPWDEVSRTKVTSLMRRTWTIDLLGKDKSIYINAFFYKNVPELESFLKMKIPG